MGYEQFIKHVFPFIGNKYNTDSENKEEPSNIKQLIITISDLTDMYKESSTGAFIDFTQNKIVAERRVQDPSSLDNKLGLIFDKGVDSWEDVSVLYVNDVAESDIYFFIDVEKEDETIEALFGKDTPFTFFSNGETAEEKDITPDILGLKYIKFEKIDSNTFVINYTLGDVPPAPIPEGKPEVEGE